MAGKVKVGVIGLGLGKYHVEGLVKDKNAEVAAICDIDRGRLEECGAKWGVKACFTDYRKILAMKDVDAVTIALPNYLHRAATVAAFQAGKHVCCEKPPAMNTREAKEMVAAGRKAKKILMIAVCMRYKRDVQHLREEVAKGRFGKVYLAKCAYLRRSGIPVGGCGWFIDKRKSGGGPIIDLGVHAIDMALFILGFPKVKAVSASAYQNFGHRVPSKYRYSVEDHAAALMRLEGGGTLVFETSWASHMKPRHASYMEIFGDKAGGRLDPLEIYGERDGVLYDEVPQVKETGWEESIGLEMSHFVECIRTGKKPLSPGEEGVAIMKILDAIYRSAKTGKEVAIK